MDQIEQSKAFEADLTSLINRYATEFDMTYNAVVGILQIRVIILSIQSQKEKE